MQVAASCILHSDYQSCLESLAVNVVFTIHLSVRGCMSYCFTRACLGSFSSVSSGRLVEAIWFSDKRKEKLYLFCLLLFAKWVLGLKIQMLIFSELIRFLPEDHSFEGSNVGSFPARISDSKLQCPGGGLNEDLWGLHRVLLLSVRKWQEWMQTRYDYIFWFRKGKLTLDLFFNVWFHTLKYWQIF